MARTADVIQDEIIAAKNADPSIGTGGASDLSSTSSVSIWRLWTRVIATAMAKLEGLFDVHKSEVAATIKAEKAHTLNWYVLKAKAYQHGDSLPDDSDVYDPVKDADDSSRVVTFAAGRETSSSVQIKVAKGTPGALSALSGPEVTGFAAYMKRVKDAGVRVICSSAAGDTLQPNVTIYYDPLVLAADGSRLDGSATSPVKDAINTFLAGLSELTARTGDLLSGRLIVDRFTDALQAVEGVQVVVVNGMQAYYGAVSPITFANWYDPDAGYLVLDETYFDANVTYTAYVG